MAAGMTSEQSGRRRFARGALYVLAAVLLGVGIVLVYQQYATDIAYWLAQQKLAGETGNIPGPETYPASAEGSPTIDLTDWAREDEAYWNALRTGKPFGRIVSQKADLDAVVLKGASQAELARGPGWIPTTDLPGATGNCAVSGHRVTHGHPFQQLDNVRVGDSIDLYSPYRRYRYEVVRILRVTPDHIEVLEHTDEPQLTLTTCDPPGRAIKRLVVQAKLVEVVRKKVGD